MNRGIKSRIAALQAYTKQQPQGVGIVSLLADGMWSASRHGRPIRIFESEQEATDSLMGCEPIIVIDL